MGDNRINIRVATLADAQDLRDIYAPYVKNTAISFEYEVPTVPDFTERIRQTLVKYPYLVAVADNEVLGYAYASEFKEREAYDWAVETSIYVKKYMRKKGVGRQLYAALEKVLVAQGFTSMNACISYPHDGVGDEFLTTNSVGFHQHMGFSKAGRFDKVARKFGRWYDMVWMEKAIGYKHEGDDDDQPQIVPFSQIVDRVPEILEQA